MSLKAEMLLCLAVGAALSGLGLLIYLRDVGPCGPANALGWVGYILLFFPLLALPDSLSSWMRHSDSQVLPPLVTFTWCALMLALVTWVGLRVWIWLRR